MSHPGPFFCPAAERRYPGGPRAEACMNLLPCAEHGIQDQNQGHREYGSVIVAEAGPTPEQD